MDLARFYPILTPRHQELYSVEVTSANGCTRQASIEVIADTLKPAIQVSDIFKTCSEDSVQISFVSNANNAAIFWSGPNGFQSNAASPYVIQTGIYDLLLVAENGCESPAQLEVIPDASIPFVALTPDTLTCIRDSIELTAETMDTGLNYEWLGPNGFVSSDSANTVFIPGLYAVTVTNALGCTNETAVQIIADITPPVFDLHADTITCLAVQSTVIANLANVNDAVTWFNSTQQLGFGPILQSPDAGQVFTVVTGDNGCSRVDSIVIEIDTLAPQFSVLLPVLDCSNPTGTLHALPPSSQWTYSWLGPNGFMSDSSSVVVSQPGSYNIDVTAPNGCSSSWQNTVLSDMTPPQLSLSPDTLTCSRTAITLTNQTTQVLIDWEWKKNGVVQGNAASLVTDQAGLFELVGKGVNGCIDSIEVLISIDTIPPIITVVDGALDCYNPSVILNASVINHVNIGWMGPGGFVSNDLQPAAFEPGNYFIEAIAGNDCKSNSELKIADGRIYPEVTATGGILDCANPQLQLLGVVQNGVDQIEWNSDQGFYNIALEPSVQDTGWYFLSARLIESGCVTTDSAYVAYDPNAPGALVYDIHQPSCHRNEGVIENINTIGGQAPYTYSIDGGLSFSADVQIGALNPGRYELLVMDDRGCTTEDSLEILSFIAVDVVTDSLIRIEWGEDAQIMAFLNLPIDDIQSISWSPPIGLSCADCLEPIVQSDISRWYKITVVDKNGCPDEERVFVKVDFENSVYAPNVFSPHNDDGINDAFTLYANSEKVVAIRDLKVFDRWGEVVFQNQDFPPNDPVYGWDGTFQKSEMNPAVFVFWAEVELITGSVTFVKGDVTLVR